MSTKSKIRFITDNTCDLPKEMLQRHQITVVPCLINYNNMSLADDGVQLDREQFYRQMPAMHPPYPTTSAMAIGMAQEALKRVAEECDHVFVVTVASGLSGVYNVFRLAATGLPPDKVTLIDSETMTMGLGYQVLVGAETAEATGDIQRTKEAVERARANVHVYCGVPSLEYLRRSGRINWASAGIGDLLQIKAMLRVNDGVVKSVGRVRTYGRLVNDLINRIRSHAPIERITLLYAGNPSFIDGLREQVRDVLPSSPEDVLIERVTPVIGVHVGPESIGAVILSRTWRA